MMRMSTWADQRGLSRATVYRSFHEGRFEALYGLRAFATGSRSYWVDTDEAPASALASKLRREGYMVLDREEFTRAVYAVLDDFLSPSGGDPEGNPGGDPG